MGINYAPDLVGVAKYNTGLCESLVAEGHDVRVITAPPYYPAWQILTASILLFQVEEDKWRAGDPVRQSMCPLVRRGQGGSFIHASFALMSAIPLVRTALSWRPDIMLSVAPSLTSAALVAVAARLTGGKVLAPCAGFSRWMRPLILVFCKTKGSVG